MPRQPKLVTPLLCVNFTDIDLLGLGVFGQSFSFFVLIFTYLPPFLHIALKCSTYSPRRSTYSPQISTYSPRTGAICNYIAPYGGNMQIFYPRYYRGISYIKKSPTYRVGKWDNICNVYIRFLRAIYNDMAPKPRIFSSEAEGRGRKIRG